MPSQNSKWNRLSNPPAPLFTNKKERDLAKQVATEIVQRAIGQQVLYYPIDVEHSVYNLYGECQEKVYLSPINIYCLVSWEDSKTICDFFGIDRIQNIKVHFSSRRIQEDQNLQVKEGDILLYGVNYYEINSFEEPRETFGNTMYKVEVTALCRKLREGYFKYEPR